MKSCQDRWRFAVLFCWNFSVYALKYVPRGGCEYPMVSLKCLHCENLPMLYLQDVAENDGSGRSD